MIPHLIRNSVTRSAFFLILMSSVHIHSWTEEVTGSGKPSFIAKNSAFPNFEDAISSDPAITTEPWSQGAMIGTSVTFEAAASGTTPMYWQWYLNDQPIAGATSNRLTRGKVDASMLGLYYAIVTNSVGSATTIKAKLDQSSIVWWGASPGGLPADNSDVISITGGDIHMLALRSNGTVEAWASPPGPGTQPTDYGQSVVPAGLDNVVSVAAGSTHSLAVRKDGTSLMWGTILFTDTSEVPTEAKNGVVMVGQGVGAQHALALKSNGKILRWGRTDDFFLPATYIPSDATNIVSVAAGAWHGLALRANGGVIAWGNNEYGQTNVPSNATGVVAIATAWHRCAALRADGQVVTWGKSGAFFTQTNIVDIACGGEQMVALTGTGRVISSGLSLSRQLTNVAGIGAGSYTSFALMGDGAPVFNTTEAERFVQLGESAYFRMWAIGTQPISYQWSFNGEPLDGATNSVLVVTNVAASRIGFYSVTATNASGFVTSKPMGLNVPPLRINRAARLGNSIELDVQTVSGQTYRLEFKDDFLETDWHFLKDVSGEAGNTTFNVIDESSPVARRFYRIRIL